LAESRKEVLRHGTIVAKLFRIMANEVPTRELKARTVTPLRFSKGFTR
jgi:hypothetical protein